jgi:hypothetical protein
MGMNQMKFVHSKENSQETEETTYTEYEKNLQIIHLKKAEYLDYINNKQFLKNPLKWALDLIDIS